MSAEGSEDGTRNPLEDVRDFRLNLPIPVGINDGDLYCPQTGSTGKQGNPEMTVFPRPWVIPTEIPFAAL